MKHEKQAMFLIFFLKNQSFEPNTEENLINSYQKEDMVLDIIQTLIMNNNSLYEVEGGKKINWEQYQKLLQDFFNDPFLSLKSPWNESLY